MAKKRIRKLTVTQEIMKIATKKLEKYQHDLTRKTYGRQMKAYVKFCREKFDARSFDECKTHVQEYSDYLQERNYSASTIHTYLASVCAVFEINLAEIKKPKRYTADYKRGRNTIFSDSRNDIENPQWSYIVEFQRRVGIRRDELKRLTSADFVCDESGRECVLVRKGKGGKVQYQRILEKDVSFIRSYFESVEPNERVFEEKYFENNLNFHGIRAECAKEYYFEQLNKIKENPEYAKELEREIRVRWMKMNLKKDGKPKNFRKNEWEGVYILRGKNRKLALEKGLPVCYDKRALLATSIFKLSHWRNDVTIASYLLA